MAAALRFSAITIFASPQTEIRQDGLETDYRCATCAAEY